MSFERSRPDAYALVISCKIALAGLPLSMAMRGWDSRINGVQIGAISYSFRSIPDPEAIIKAMVQYRPHRGRAHVESRGSAGWRPQPGTRRAGGGRAPAGPPSPAPAPAGSGCASGASPAPLAAAPPATEGQGRGRATLTPEQQAEIARRQEELKAWRASVSMDKFKAVRKRFDDAGIEAAVALLQHERPHDRKTPRLTTRSRWRKRLGVQGHVHVDDAGQHREAGRAVRRQAPDHGRLPRPLEHHRLPTKSRHPESFDDGDVLFQVPRRQPRHRPFHGCQLRSDAVHHAASRRASRTSISRTGRTWRPAAPTCRGGRATRRSRTVLQLLQQEQVGSAREHRVRISGR